MTRRPLTTDAAMTAHLEWLRDAIRDRHVDVRLVLEGLLDALVMLDNQRERPPGPPGPR